MGWQDVTRLLQRAVQDGDVAGVVAGAASRDGLAYEAAVGRRGVGSEAHMTADTVFWLASMTKPVTSVAALQLVEEGRLDLDEPLGFVLPELDGVPVLEGFGADGAPRLRPARRRITLRHLLTHTAGFSYDMWNGDVVRFMARTGASRTQTPLVADPGDRWEYGISTDWVGRAVEAASGQSLEAYFRARISDPLGMRDTAFVPGPDARPRLAARHARQPDGSLERVDVEAPRSLETFAGGGGLYSTARDYLSFLRMLLNEGTLGDARILAPESVRAMCRNQLGALDVRPLKSAVPALTNDVEFFPGMVKKWGLGGMLTTEEAPTGRRAGSLAWCGVANTYFWLDPVERLAGVFLTQILPLADPKVLDLFAAFETEAYSEHRPRGMGGRR